MDNLAEKISLGTVQFGLDYGISNSSGKVQKKEVVEILKSAGSRMIDLLDTSHSYGDSEKLIGEILHENPVPFKIVSKLPPLGKGSLDQVDDLFATSLSDLKVNSIYGYLIHRYEDYLSDQGLWERMRCLREKGLIKKIGFSLYNPNELDTILNDEIDFDIVQVPYSVFDQRFSEYFEFLSGKGIEIHVRSVFLQGLVFLAPEELPGYLAGARDHLMKLRCIESDYGVPISAICLNFPLLNKDISRVVIGVDGLSQFEEDLNNLNYSEKISEMMDLLVDLRIYDENIILPYKWSRKG